MLGALVGDIVGSVYEWNNHRSKDFPLFSPKSCFTDDSVLTVALADVGRQKVTNQDKDTGAFKTPTLRDVARSAPYFHDGSVATLEEAVKFMVGGGADNPFLDKTNLQKADLSAAEVTDLIEFLKSLNENTRIPEPKLP